MESERHPDLIELELLRTGEASAEVSRHVEGCVQCQDELKRLSALAGNLRISQTDAPAISPAADAVMLDFIRGRAAAIRTAGQSRQTFRFFRYAVAMAASLVLAAFLAWAIGFGHTSQAPAAVAGDFNGDGRMDVIDAYLLAKAQDAGEIRKEWDVNGDQMVDRRDAAEMLRRIVAIGEEG